MIDTEIIESYIFEQTINTLPKIEGDDVDIQELKTTIKETVSSLNEAEKIQWITFLKRI